MRAIQVKKVGGPSVLQLAEVETPRPKPNEVLVKIAAAGVNFIDVYFREGRYPSPLPFINGQEAAGTVVEAGSDVANVKVGDRVVYVSIPGSYAEYQAVPAERVVRIPEHLSEEDAAAAMLQGLTAHYLLHSTFQVKKGDTILVHAAAGGTGLLLTQWAKYLGARVISTVGTEAKAELAREAGADEVILYSQEDFVAAVKRVAGAVDAIYDGVGKQTFNGDLEILKPRGWLVLFGASSGAVPPFDPILLSQKGSLVLTRPTLAHFIRTREDLEQRATELMNMVASGKLRLRISKKYPLASAAQAHTDLEGRATTGKLLLIP
jgi:NADPH:quinone reductase